MHPANRLEPGVRDPARPKTMNTMTRSISERALALAHIAGAFIIPFTLAAAPCGPQPEGRCVECGPYYGIWSVDWCPYVNNSPGIGLGGITQCPGDVPQWPTVTAPTYAVGQKERTKTWDCSPPTTDYAGITYSVGAVQWDPPLPATFTPANCPAFTSSPYVVVTSSDPTLCPSPGRVYFGAFTWDVRCECAASTYTTNCTEGSVTLTNVTVSPTNGCVGTAFSASVSQNISNGQVIVTTHYTNACGRVDTNTCPDTYTTNEPSPTIVSNWWTVTGVGATPPSGTGTGASFTATNTGTGTVTFYTKWQHVCDTGTSTASASASFSVRCPTMSSTALSSACGPTRYGATFRYCFDCADTSWWTYESVTWGATHTCSPGAGPIHQTTTPVQLPVAPNCVGDDVSNGGNPPDVLNTLGVSTCTDETSQVIYLGPTQADVNACSYNNTQTITITRSSGNHGTVTTTSGGATASCTY